MKPLATLKTPNEYKLQEAPLIIWRKILVLMKKDWTLALNQALELSNKLRNSHMNEDGSYDKRVEAMIKHFGIV